VETSALNITAASVNNLSFRGHSAPPPDHPHARLDHQKRGGSSAANAELWVKTRDVEFQPVRAVRASSVHCGLLNG